MQKNDIPDEQIPTASPEAVVIQYSGLIKKIAGRYSAFVDRSGAFDTDDLLQAGRIAILEAQSKYDPGKGISFVNFSINYLKKGMRRTIGINNEGQTEPVPIPLDKPLSSEDGSSEKIMDLIPDPKENTEGNYIEQETQEEIIREVREAVGRLQNEKQREAIRRVYLEEQERKTVAADLEIDSSKLNQVLTQGKYRMKLDMRLIHFARPLFTTSLSTFRRTWTSSVEAEILWKEQAYNHKFGEGSFFRMPDPDSEQDSMQEATENTLNSLSEGLKRRG